MSLPQNVETPSTSTARRNRTARSRMLMTMIAGITSVAVLTACTSAAGETTGAESSAAATTVVGTGSASAMSDATDSELFDSSVVHTISIDYDEAEYQTMIDTFVASGDKEWITATVTIDGTVFENVGIKLKGNSTLQSLRSVGSASTDPAETDATATDSTENDDAEAGQQGFPGGGMGGGMNSNVSADDPSGLPWRIKLDKFVDGQNYQGETDIVVRGNNTETSLNEAVALELLSEAGLASEEAISTRFSVNGSEQTLRLVIQNPSDEWYDANYDSDGILYKAEAGGDYSYRGDDPASYADVFDVEASTTGEDDYTPLISFLQFINESDDATFAAELSEHLDVQAFANYLAMQDLVANTDDIDGPGNNSYLKYDAATSIFTVVPWDQNLSFGGMGGGAQGGGAQAAGGPGGGAGGPGGGQGIPTDMAGEMPTDMAGAGDAAGDAGGDRPQRAGGFGQAGQGGGARGGNILAERFKANADFNALYEQAKVDLADRLYTSGDAQAILDQWVSVLTSQAGDLVSADTIESEAAAISEYFTAN